MLYVSIETEGEDYRNVWEKERLQGEQLKEKKRKVDIKINKN